MNEKNQHLAGSVTVYCPLQVTNNAAQKLCCSHFAKGMWSVHSASIIIRTPARNENQHILQTEKIRNTDNML